MERVCGVFEALVSILLTIAVVLKVDIRIILLGCFVSKKFKAFLSFMILKRLFLNS